jgi:hypothetical protein
VLIIAAMRSLLRRARIWPIPYLRAGAAYFTRDGRARGAQAGKRVDATNAQDVAFTALVVLGQCRLCFAGEGSVIHRCCLPRYEVIIQS